MPPVDEYSCQKELALKKLEERRKKNKKIKRVDNSSLYAGSPMYYYCRICGKEMVEPETHWGPAPRYCGECEILIENGWAAKI